MTSTRWRCTISKSPPSFDVPQNKCSQDERRDKKRTKQTPRQKSEQGERRDKNVQGERRDKSVQSKRRDKSVQSKRRDKKANKANEMQEFIFALLSRRAEVRGVKGLHFVMAKPKSIKLVEFFLKKQ